MTERKSPPDLQSTLAVRRRMMTMARLLLAAALLPPVVLARTLAAIARIDLPGAVASVPASHRPVTADFTPAIDPVPAPVLHDRVSLTSASPDAQSVSLITGVTHGAPAADRRSDTGHAARRGGVAGSGAETGDLVAVVRVVETGLGGAVAQALSGVAAGQGFHFTGVELVAAEDLSFVRARWVWVLDLRGRQRSA